MPNFKAFSEGKGPTEVQSAEVIINGMPWTILIEYNGKWLEMYTCIQIERTDFACHCNAAKELAIVSEIGKDFRKGNLNDYQIYRAKGNCWGDDEFIEFEKLMAPEEGFYNEREDAVTFKAKVKAEKPKGLLQIHAEHPLQVNGKLVHVNKYILAAQSEFFNKLFFGEKEGAPCDGTPKIEIERIENAVENFKQLISVVNSPNFTVDKDYAERVRQLANRFEMKSVGINRTRGQILFKMPNFRAFSEGNAYEDIVLSDKVSADGMSWKIRIKKNRNFLSIYLYCDGDTTDSNWSREVAAKFVVVSPTKGISFAKGDLLNFDVYNNNSKYWGYDKFASFEALMDPRNGAYDPREDTVTFKCEFIVKNRKEPYQAYTFDADDNLRVNGQAVKVNKFLLAAHSPLFQEFFFELNSENGTPNIPIDGMENAEEKFRHLIAFVNSPNAELDDDCVENVLLLADRFQLDSVVNRCVHFLMTKSKRSMLNKLKLAKQFNILGMEKSVRSEIKEGKFIIDGNKLINLIENDRMDSDKKIDELIKHLIKH